MNKCKHCSIKLTGNEQLGNVTCCDCGEIIPVHFIASYLLTQLRLCVDVMSKMIAETEPFNPMEGI